MSQPEVQVEAIQRIVREAFQHGMTAASDSVVSKIKDVDGAIGSSAEPGVLYDLRDDAIRNAASKLPKAAQLVLYDTVQEQISQLFGHLLAGIKRKRNALTPIETLSDELLARIFLFAAAGHAHRAAAKFRLTQVCARWRTLALADARLWADVDLAEPPRVLAACLSRAREALVALRYAWSFDAVFNHDVLAVFAPRAHRVRSLAVNLPAGELVPVGLPLVTTPLPCVESVHIAVLESGWGDDVSAEGPLVDVLFGSNAPNLRYLRLQRFGLPWTLSQHTKLTTIMLDNCYFVGPAADMDFITVLGSLPALQQLSLMGCQNLCNYGSMNTRLISLPDLRIAQLDGLRARDLVQILSSVATQPTLRLTVKVRFGEGDPLSIFGALDLTHIASLSTVTDLAVDITHVNMTSLEILTFTGAPARSGARKNLVFTVERGEGAPAWHSTSLPTLCAPFAFSRLTKLGMTWRQSGWTTPPFLAPGAVPPAPFDAGDALTYFLDQNPGIVSLALSGWTRPGSLDMLAQRDGDVAPAPCLKLNTLRFDMSSLTDTGLKNLVLRRPGCTQIRYLTLGSSVGFKSETVDWLRENMEDVYWDGEINEVSLFDRLL